MPLYPAPGIASVAVDEVAHSLGLPEAYQQTQSGTRFDLVGMWDPMSEPNPHHFLAWHKYRVGWIAQDEIACIDAPRQERVTLRPQETRGSGIQATVIRTGPSNAYVVEARFKLGLDGTLCNEGVLVYTVDSQVRNGGGPIYIHRSAPDDPARQVPCGTLHNAPFQPGQTFEDGQVKVTVVSRTGSTYVLDVTRKG